MEIEKSFDGCEKNKITPFQQVDDFLEIHPSTDANYKKCGCRVGNL